MDNDFLMEQQAAMKRMLEMSARAQAPRQVEGMPPVPPFVRVPNEQVRQDRHNTGSSQNTGGQRGQEGKKQGFDIPLLGGLNLPFLDKLKTDSDLSLLIGLILILLSEKADKKLLLALVYILM